MNIHTFSRVTKTTSLSVVWDRAPQRLMERRRKSPRRSFTNTLSTLSIMGVCGGPLGFGLASMSAGGWLRQTDPRLAPPSGGRRGFYVKATSDPEVVGLTLWRVADHAERRSAHSWSVSCSDWRCFGCPFAVLGNLYIISTRRQDVDVPVVVHTMGYGPDSQFWTGF